MSFTGFSSDEEGTIIYDGEKFIVNVPVGHEQLEHFKPDGKIPVVYTHPSHAQDQQSSSTSVQPIVSYGSSSPTAAAEPKTPTYVEDVEAYGQRAEERVAEQNREESLTDIAIAQDIEWQNDANAYDLAGFLQLAANLGEEHASGKAKTLQVINGTGPDGEEEDLDQAWKDLLQTTARIGLFEDEPWYTMRLGPAPSTGVSAFQSDYIDMAFTYGQGILEPGRRFSDGITVNAAGSETQTIDGTTRTGEETDERWYRGSETELDPYLRHALAQTYSGGTMGTWNEEWTHPEHLEGFLKGNLVPFLPEEYIDSLPWDDLTDFGKIHIYSYLMQTLHDETWHLNSPNSDRNIRLDDAAESAEALLLAVTAVPLVNEARLVEEFGYPDAVTARIDLTVELQFAYENLGVSPPDELHEWSLLQLANEYRDVLANVFIPYYSKEMGAEAYSKSLDFAAEYEDIAHSDPRTMIARLEGNQQNSPLELVFFVASFFIEPLDLALTIGDMITAAGEGDLWGAAWSGFLGLVPGAFGQLVKRSDNIARHVDVPTGKHNWQLENPVPTDTVPNQLRAESCVAACGVELFERTTGLRITEEQMLRYMGYDGNYGISLKQGEEGLNSARNELAANTSAEFSSGGMDVHNIAKEIAEGNTVVAALGRHAVVVEGVDLQSGIVKVSDPWGRGPGTGIAELGELRVERFEDLQRMGAFYQVIVGVPGSR